MSHSTELFLVRHGETAWNAEGRIQGWTDIPLSEVGEAQARAAAARLSVMGWDGVWCSDLGRARRTAELLGVDAQPDCRLRELFFGDIEGLTWEQVRDVDREALMVFDQFQAPGGESVADLMGRVEKFLAELVVGRHLVITHGGPIRGCLRRCGSMGPVRLPNLSVAEIDWTRKQVLRLPEG